MEASCREYTPVPLRQDEQQARAEAQQCREEKARLRAECSGQGGLTELIAYKWMDEKGVIARVLKEITPPAAAAGQPARAAGGRRGRLPGHTEAIKAARTSISLCSYIFDNDEAGRRFVDALGRAVKRRVQVRVLIDALGVRYDWPPITGRLRRARGRVARFSPRC
ncbi:hypothetical protein [Archangium violaceum]|uniref:hypothetical protein n=1 Tax=Archangium violaceum TaxID=83451 RepID=UPI001EF0E34C|nr:hypothetical protein [Archangium violaceum]